MAGARNRTRLTRAGRRLLVLAAVAWLSSGVAWAQARCVTAEIPATFVLPDGSVHDAGELRLCVERVHSPVAVLHRIYVEDAVVALFESRTGRGESVSMGRPFVLLHRNALDQLELIGYARPSGRAMDTHVLAERKPAPPAAAALDLDSIRIGNEELVLVAAR
jgi:hypothetical protein